MLLVIFGIALYFNIQNAIFLYDKFAKIRENPQDINCLRVMITVVGKLKKCPFLTKRGFGHHFIATFYTRIGLQI